MEKGCFITFEGPDGAGKTTQIVRLKAWAESLGHSVVLTREPGGTPLSEKIREMVLGYDYREMDAVSEALLYAAARAQHVADVILPALDKGKLVICDRFVDSSMAYQAYGRMLGVENIRVINQFACRGIVPDLTFLMLLDPVIAAKRMEGKVLDRLEAEAMDFKQRVYEGYRTLAREQASRIAVLDARLSEDKIAAMVLERAQQCIALPADRSETNVCQKEHLGL